MLLAGCAALGILTPENFSERLAAGYVTVTGIRNTAGDLLEAQKIGSQDAENIQAAADTGRAGLDISRTMRASDPDGADDRLTATIAGLTALEAYLKSKGN
jgi:hypothetical protein